MSEVKDEVVESVKEVTGKLGNNETLIGWLIIGGCLAVGYKVGKSRGRKAANKDLFKFVNTVKFGIDIGKDSNKDSE